MKPATEEIDDEDDEVPDLVENFDEASKEEVKQEHQDNLIYFVN